MTTPKDIKDELVEDLEATEEEADNVKGGSGREVRADLGPRKDMGPRFKHGKHFS